MLTESSIDCISRAINTSGHFKTCYEVSKKLNSQIIWSHLVLYLNLFVPNAPFHYPLKTSENLTVVLGFQRVKKGCIGNKWVKIKYRNFTKFMVGKLYGRAQFPHNFGQLARNYVETVFLQNCHITKFGEITAYHGDFLKNFMRKLWVFKINFQNSYHDVLYY